MEFIWIFNGENSRFPGGAFTDIGKAEEWIGAHRLSGVLTKYPLDKGVYDWAIGNGVFTVKKEEHTAPSFIGRFTAAGQEHFHYEDGKRS